MWHAKGTYIHRHAYAGTHVQNASVCQHMPVCACPASLTILIPYCWSVALEKKTSNNPPEHPCTSDRPDLVLLSSKDIVILDYSMSELSNWDDKCTL